MPSSRRARRPHCAGSSSEPATARPADRQRRGRGQRSPRRCRQRRERAAARRGPDRPDTGAAARHGASHEIRHATNARAGRRRPEHPGVHHRAHPGATARSGRHPPHPVRHETSHEKDRPAPIDLNTVRVERNPNTFGLTWRVLAGDADNPALSALSSRRARPARLASMDRHLAWAADDHGDLWPSSTSLHATSPSTWQTTYGSMSQRSRNIV
jgi:hypothetical protein